MSADTSLPLHRGRADRAPQVIGQILVDSDDFEWARLCHWTLNASGYAARRIRNGAQQRSVLLHREILGLVDGDYLVADHINRNKLDCRRSNLRVVTRAQNNQNRDAYRNGRSRFRGVSWDGRRECWRATAQVNGEWKQIGRFATEEAAGAAAADWRREYMPFSTELPVAA